MAARAVLAQNGVETEVVYPALLRHAAARAGRSRQGGGERAHGSRRRCCPGSTKGYDVVALVPSCALMLKFEWPLILPGDADVKQLVRGDLRRQRICRRHRQARGPGAGPEARSMAASRCISPAMPGPRTWARRRPRCCASFPAPISTVIERCSGHGGSWGVRKENFEIALKVGKPVARHGEGRRQAPGRLGMPAGRRAYPPGHREARAASPPPSAPHPIELFARAYGA